MFPVLALYLFYLQLLVWLSIAEVSYPTTVEFDIIFPRNDTYAPTDLMPFIFAFQNPLVLPDLIQTLDFSVFKYNGSLDVNNGVFETTFDLTSYNYSNNAYFAANVTNPPYFLPYVNTELNAEGSYFLLWYL